VTAFSAGRTCDIIAEKREILMLDWQQCSAVERIPGKVSGEWLFKGTRVPVKALFENLEGGARVDIFSNGSQVSRAIRSRRF
jgi:hypothetical protein